MDVTEMSQKPDTPLSLLGSLPGEGASKGEHVNIKVIADDGTHEKEITLTRKISEGGEGAVFETDAGRRSEFVAKIYHRNKLVASKFDKIRLMLAQEISIDGVCFPVAIIRNEENERVGFLMPRARGFELGKSVFMPKLLQQKFPTWTKRETIQLCITILRKIKYLNENGIILGDINGQNILVSSPVEVYFVDCDSYQIGSYPCPAGTENFTAPEAQGKTYTTFLRTQEMENFAIATLLFMIMLPGKAPYAAVGGAGPAENIRNGSFAYESKSNSRVPPGKWGFIWSHMSFRIREAFAETFRKNGKHFDPNSRLDAGEWLELFEAYQRGLPHMQAWDPMAIDLFPKRCKLRKCNICGNKYAPDPIRYLPFCPTCEAKRQEAEDLRHRQREQYLHEVWKRYPCKNPKCNIEIILYNKDRSRFQNRKLPEYCNACWQETPCRECGYTAAKWMHDERDGLCRKCYEKRRRAEAAANKQAQQQRTAAAAGKQLQSDTSVNGLPKSPSTPNPNINVPSTAKKDSKEDIGYGTTLAFWICFAAFPFFLACLLGSCTGN